MKTEYELIKEDYGERFAKFCRSSFPTLIEEKLLYEIISDHFAPSRFLFDDIVVNKAENNFIKYINSFAERASYSKRHQNVKPPEELMLDAGYKLYKCETVEDVMSFMKYYAKYEELCTFNNPEGRLKYYHIYFAVKTDVEEIKREDFNSPQRQDRYGISVISLQFSKGSNYLSIKNRYNHTVANPDSTFSNNLDNIIDGLTQSFYDYYHVGNLDEKEKVVNFEMPNYVNTDGGKWYHYNYELNNIYYCDNNVVIIDWEAKQFNKERFEIIDYFILDRKLKRLYKVDKFLRKEEFSDFIDIEKIDVKRVGKSSKLIEVYIKDKIKPIQMIADSRGRMMYFSNPNLKFVPRNYFESNLYLQEIKLENATNVGFGFCWKNKTIKKCIIPKANIIEEAFMVENTDLTELIADNCSVVYGDFLNHNKSLKALNMPNLEVAGGNFLIYNECLEILNTPKLKNVGTCFLFHNNGLKELNLPSLEELPYGAFGNNVSMQSVNLPVCERIGRQVLPLNKYIKVFNAPMLTYLPEEFLYSNKYLKRLYLPNVLSIGGRFLCNNNSLQILDLPKVETIDGNALIRNSKLTYLSAPNLRLVHPRFLSVTHTGVFKYLDCDYLKTEYKFTSESKNSQKEDE